MKKLSLILLTVFVIGLVASCGTHKRCPGVYGKVGVEKNEKPA